MVEGKPLNLITHMPTTNGGHGGLNRIKHDF